MKTSLLTSLGLLVLVSCGQPDSSSESSVQTEMDENTNSCLVDDESVSRDVFEEWVAEYTTFAQSHGYEEMGYRLNSETTMITLESALWSQFTDRCPDCEGTRVYFGAYLDSASGVFQQFLMLTNTSGVTCNDSAYDEEGVLMLQPIEGSGFIDPSVAAEYHSTWKNYIMGVQEKMPSMLYVEAYSFTRSSFQDAFELNDSILGIYYGKHTVMPEDTYYEHTELNNGAEGWITFNLMVTSLDETGGYAENSHMDYARPCPKICSNKRFYMSAE